MHEIGAHPHALSPGRPTVAGLYRERLFTVDDVLDASRQSDIPVGFDWLHHAANPGKRLGDERALLDECLATCCLLDGVPNTHCCSQAPDRKRGAYPDYGDANEFVTFLRVARPRQFDCMPEAEPRIWRSSHYGRRCLRGGSRLDSPDRRGWHGACITRR